MKKLLILLLAAGIIQISAIAQSPQRTIDPAAGLRTGVVKGVIHDSTTNGAIEYATVGLYRQSDSSLVNGVVTGSTGSFAFKDLAYDSYYLEANFIGYSKKIISSVNISPQVPTVDFGVIVLHPDITQIASVEIVAQSKQVEYRIDKKVVNISQDISAAGGSLVNVLENTPSVEVDIEGNVSLRGSGNFQLLVDGKPSVVQGSEGLQQIPASAVQSLEIITSPSAKYDPDGAAGIINIIMKKQKNTGIGGVANVSIGTKQKYTADFLLNFKREKLNFFIGGEYSDRDFHMRGENERSTFINNITTTNIGDAKGVFSRNSYNVKSGFDYYIDDNSTLSLSGGVGRRSSNRDFISLNHWYTLPASIDSFYTDESFSTDEDKFYNLNLDFLKKFDDNGHSLQASVYYSAATEIESDEQIVKHTDSNYEILGTDPKNSRSSMRNPESDIRLEVDYTRPVGRGKIEAGLQSRMDNQEGNYIFEDYQPLGGEWLVNDSISNSLDYRDALQSVYGIYSAPLGKFEYQLGVRAEYDNRTLKQRTSSESYTYEKMHFFPSFYVLRKLSDAHQFQFTFSTRIQRPSMWNLNPFKEFRGSNNIRYGNPSLKPEFSNAYELNYQYTFEKGSVSLETYYRRTTDKITWINGIDSISGRQVFVNTVTNADEDHSLGMELMTNLDLTKWWQLSLTGNLFRYQLNGEVAGENVSRVSTNWRTNFNSNFKLKWDLRLQVSGVYNGPSKTLQGERSGFFMANVAVRKEMLKRQLSVSVNARDVFATGFSKFTSEGADFYTYNEFRREAPVVMLNLTYRINNYRQAGRRNGDDEGGDDGGGMDMGM